MAKKISFGKQIDIDFNLALGKFTNVDHCVLCNKKVTSTNRSHVVPKFILEEIAGNDGRIYYGQSLHKRFFVKPQGPTGKKNAHVFRLICSECDKKLFADYENPNNIVNFANLNENLKKKMFCEMAIKAHLAHISSKYRLMVSKDMATSGKLGELENAGKFVFPERNDIDEHFDHIFSIKKHIKSNKNPFNIIYNKVLDYQTEIATQTLIQFNYDLNGKPRYIGNNLSYFYLMVLPYQGKTLVTFYVEERDVKSNNDIISQFNELTDKEKLHLLFITMIVYDEHFFMSTALHDKIFKEDKKIIKLYTKSEFNPLNQRLISNFRNYSNYFIK